ncbi:MAG: short-chain fatty acid transporter [Deltaproteobacteria bacterium]|jgi:short-chain fatty acids transporter|nr:short-chain fatty acid transporter [Deltaproteobacteria bacterium]
MKALVRILVSIMQKYLPDAFLFAVILTFVSFLGAFALTDKGVMDILQAWGDGLWGLLGFSMQMILIVVTGHTMAISRPIKKLLATLASIPKTPAGAAALCSFVAGICFWINWGFGLIVAALLARELARRVRGLDYGYVVASGYTGLVVWHGGLSGSIPLAVATKGHLVEKLTGIIPTTETIFTGPNLIICGVTILALPVLFKFMCPTGSDVHVVDPALLVDPEEPKEPAVKTLAQKLEYSRVVTLVLGLMGVVYLLRYFYVNGAMNLSLNIVIFVFMWAGIILHGTPISYVRAVNEAIKGAGGIAVQFPLYSGIQGIMIGTGLAGIVAQWFISFSTELTFPLFTFIAGGIINFFVPSGGGQWVVQGPINIPAGIELGVSSAKVAMSIAYGDQWTNLIQPFWALPLLGIAKLGAKDIMGYCAMALVLTGVIYGAGLLFLPW